MRKFLKVLLIIVVVLVVFVGAFAAYVATRTLPTHTPQKITVNIDYTPERIANGTRLASMLCKNCHYNDATHKFTGRELTEAPQFGKIYSKNITHDANAGIGSWTNGELVYFIRTGIRRDGKYIPPYMPKLIHISDEDLYSIISFLRSDNAWVQADPTKQLESQISFLTKFLLTIKAVKAFPYPTQPVPEPDTTDLVKHGKYIALNQLECYSCHSQDFAKNDYLNPEKSPGFFGGGNKLINTEGQQINSLNITMDENTGIGKWSEDQFVTAVKTGILPNNQPALRNPMNPYTNLSDKEVKAIYAYLKTVPKLNNKVERKMYQK